MKQHVFWIFGIFLVLAGCNSPAPTTLSTTPASLSVSAGDPAQVIRATVQNSSAGVVWSLSPNLGSLNTTTGLEVRYLPPKDLANDTTITLTATLSGTHISSKTQISLKAGQPALRPSLSLQPKEVTLSGGDAPFSFNTTVENSTAAVVWSLSSNVGSLSSTQGRSVEYTPPSTLSAPTTVTLTAQLEGSTVQDTATITLQPKASSSLSISPRGNPTLTLNAGSPTQTFTATLANNSSPVVWSITPSAPSGGSLRQVSPLQVEYTPPASLTSDLQVTLTARVEGGSLQDSVSIVVKPVPIPSLSISPKGNPTLTLNAGSPAQSFSASLTNSIGPVVWSISPSAPTGGSLRQISPLQVEYTPPATLSSDLQVTLTARVEGTTLQDSVPLLIKAVTAQFSVSPSSATLLISSAANTFTAQLQNSTGTINWQLSPALGSLDTTTGPTVRYTPPKALLAERVTLTATVSGTTLRAQIPITLQEPPFPTKANVTEPIRPALLPTPTECKSFSVPTSNEALAGYPSKISYYPGENLQLHVNSPAGSYNVYIYQEGSTPVLRHSSTGLSGQRQALPDRPFATDLNWPVGFSYTIPSTWGSGLYNAILSEVTTQRCYEVVFLVKRPSALPKPPIVVLAANFTWQGYNTWGGASFYRCASNHTTCMAIGTGFLYSPIVTHKRPNPLAHTRRTTKDFFTLGYFTMLLWLERQGYSFDVIADTDLDLDPNALRGYKVLVLDRHAEYTSSAMYDRIEGFLNTGGNLFNSGANQMYWKTVAKEDLIEVRKDSAVSTHTLNGERGGLWRYLGRPESAVLGVRYNYTGFNTFARYVVRDPNHWSFAGTNVQLNQTFGEGCSGFETDTIDITNSPRNLELIARGANVDTTRAGPAGGEIVYYQHRGGGGVFSVGSMMFGTCLQSDPIVSRIMRNAMERLLQ